MEDHVAALPIEVLSLIADDLQKSMLPENQVLDDLDNRREVLKVLGAPLAFASPSEKRETCTTEVLMNYFLWCYFERGSAWQNCQTLVRDDHLTLEKILEGHEFNAFGFQGERHLSLLPSEYYVTQGVVSINTPEWNRRIELRVPKAFQNLLTYKTLEYFAEEIAQFKAELGEWLEEVKAEIGVWLTNNYEGINPTKNGFIQWFFANHGYIDAQIAFVPITPEYSIYEVNYTKKHVETTNERLVHAYCEHKRRQQHEHKKAALVNPGGFMQLMMKGENQLSKQVNATFESLFVSESHRQKAMEALTLVDPPLISKDGKWIGKKRGGMSAIIAWVDVLELRGYIRKVDDRLLLSKLLNQTFDGLYMNTDNDSLWGKLTKPYNQHHAEFFALLP